MTTLDDALRRCPAIAIIRAGTSRWVPAVLDTLLAQGLSAVELTMTTPGALGALRAAADADLPGLALGAGTVLDAASARAAVEAGATYLICPAVLPEVLAEGARLGVPVLPGALTPTEVLLAHQSGGALVKVFPVGSVGGAEYVRALRAPLPAIPLVPTGGIRLDEAADYLRAGARAVGVGSPLVGDAADGGDLAALARRATELVDRLREHADG